MLRKSLFFMLLSLLLICLLVSGCWFEKEKSAVEQIEEVPEEVKEPIKLEEEKEPVKEQLEELVEEIVEEPVKQGCTDNDECEWGKKCIDGVCSTIAELYDTDCENKCNFNSVVVKTSDGETYTLNRGKSAYTAAGALSWKLLSGPDYCPGDEIIVPIEIEKLSLGKVLNKQTITVNKGDKSEAITHPKMKSISFTLEITDLNEICS